MADKINEPWKTTDLKGGPLQQDCYDYTVPYAQIPVPLSANTVYQYRAYMGVDGQWYSGDTCIILTDPIPYDVPEIQTGCAVCIGTNCMQITGSTVIDKNCLDVTAYGVVYTQNSVNGTTACLTIPKAEDPYSGVHKKQINNNISTGCTFFTGGTCVITPLINNTTTFYRGFAQNSCGYGYGQVCQVQTLTDPRVSFTNLQLDTSQPDLSCVHYFASLKIEPPLGVGESFTLCYNNIAHICKTTSQYAMACTYLCYGVTKYCSVTNSISEGFSGNITCQCSGSIDIHYNTNLDSYVFHTIARFDSSNFNLNNIVCSSSFLTEIVNNISCNNYCFYHGGLTSYICNGDECGGGYSINL